MQCDAGLRASTAAMMTGFLFLSFVAMRFSQFTPCMQSSYSLFSSTRFVFRSSMLTPVHGSPPQYVRHNYRALLSPLRRLLSNSGARAQDSDEYTVSTAIAHKVCRELSLSRPACGAANSASGAPSRLPRILRGPASRAMEGALRI